MGSGYAFSVSFVLQARQPTLVVLVLLVLLVPTCACALLDAGGDADHIYIKGRKGFVAVAVEQGVDIVSVGSAGGVAFWLSQHA